MLPRRSQKYNDADCRTPNCKRNQPIASADSMSENPNDRFAWSQGDLFIIDPEIGKKIPLGQPNPKGIED